MEGGRVETLVPILENQGATGGAIRAGAINKIPVARRLFHAASPRSCSLPSQNSWLPTFNRKKMFFFKLADYRRVSGGGKVRIK